MRAPCWVGAVLALLLLEFIFVVEYLYNIFNNNEYHDIYAMEYNGDTSFYLIYFWEVKHSLKNIPINLPA